jgi:hypothetical protein
VETHRFLIRQGIGTDTARLAVEVEALQQPDGLEEFEFVRPAEQKVF